MTSSAKSRARADQLDRKLSTLENRGVRNSRAIVRRAVRSIVDAYKKNGSPGAVAVAVDEAMEPLEQLLAAGMLATHLHGYLAIVEAARPKLGQVVKALASPFDAAVEFAQRRLEATGPMIEDLRKKYQDQALFVMDEAGQAIEKRAQASISASLKSGETLADGADRLADDLARIGLNPRRPYLIETLWRTQTQLAFSAGRLSASKDPALQEILWGYEYVTVGDDRVRPNHALLDGLRRPKDDVIWKSIMPPNGYNCRCVAVEIFRGDDEAEQTPVPKPTEIDGKEAKPKADEGFDFNPGDLASDLIKVK